MDDWQLLNEYATTGSEEAFRSLVEGYAGMVYHTALRQLGNAHAAEEVSQVVFIVLARKAGGIRRQATLYGWLFRTARYAVLNHRRKDFVRIRHEQEVLEMQITTDANDADAVWEQITPQLNGALERLSAGDRELVLIRYFGNRSHKDAAAALGISEDTARKRISRAIEKLRAYFSRRGIVIPSVALAAAFAAHGAQAAPASLAGSLAGAALAKGAAAGATGASAANGVLKLMAWAKLKQAGLISLAVLAAAGGAKVVLDDRAPEIPAEVLAQLAKQKAAMKVFYLESEEIAVTPGQTRLSRTLHKEYYDGGRFYNFKAFADHSHEYSFDGQTAFTIHRGVGFPDPPTIESEALATLPEPVSTGIHWDFPYLRAAGIDTPAPTLVSLKDEPFAGLEPVLLHYLSIGRVTGLEHENDDLRVTCEIKDRWLLNARHLDADRVRQQADNGADGADASASRAEDIRRWQAMEPVRKVRLLLDAKHGYAASEIEEWTAKDQKILHIVAQDWRYYEGPGVWLPTRCVTDRYTQVLQLKDFHDEPIQVSTILLIKAEFGPQNIAFALDPTQPVASTAPKVSGTAIRGFVLVDLLIFAGFGAWFYWRSKRRRQARLSQV